jgi:pimeloyl-ACP methyl ester carboxylesterase
MDFIVCCRSTKGADFGDEVGTVRHLAVPENAQTHRPVHQLGLKAWIKDVTQEAESARNPVSGNPEGDVLFFVHGYNMSAQDVLRRHRVLRRGLKDQGYKGALVSFDWPSGTVAAAYLLDREKADRSAYKLVSGGIAPFVQFNDPVRCDVKVHVLAHSMGAYVTREAFDKADDSAEASAKNWSVSQLMFCGADVSSDSMGPSDSSRSLYLHSVRVTNYYNRHDAVLSVSGAKRVGISPRAGRIGLPDTAPSKAVDIDCSDYYDAHRDTFEAVPNKDHSFYFADKIWMQDLHETIKGDRDRLAFDTRVMRGGRVNLKVPTA